MEKWSPKTSQLSCLKSYLIDQETIEAKKQISNARESQTNNINVERNKDTKLNRNHLRTGETTPSNNKKTFLTVDKTINHQHKSTKVKFPIVISSNHKILQRFGFKGKATISKHRYYFQNRSNLPKWKSIQQLQIIQAIETN